MTRYKALIGVAIPASLSVTLALACASSPPPPSAAPPAPAPVERAAETAPAPAEAATAAPASESPAAAPAATEAAPTPAPASLPEPKDECTPVGVDFEKRARPKLKECYAQGKKKDPNLEGTVKIKITVDLKGKIKSTKVVDKTLPGPVADCMLKAVKATPFPEVDKCWDASLTIPITFPTPR